ncbi:nitrate/sulfonate/bicarbonate ABC transporter ATPase [Advenella kashmirensis WT001]|uniref:Nitrate/sulfonate/bicarbonate ABC transporter ATPase n=1 Tax=Advenella kashmirensis (strain DSM 17095 / LMG 22695 / WT001) TaxID=1036672 RepID=I3UH83_ADVKW|nr:ABC transporter ATP-binding protein [Advenella kashmirensis]AFK64371.1 nitrate/sulfonate/bicarbonate ABC transporter ATPase [Advenella kashmirensis WT001]
MTHALKNTSLRLAATPAQVLQKSQPASQSAPTGPAGQASLPRGDVLPEASLPEALFRAERVNLRYQTGDAIVQATRDVSFSIYKGDRFILLGPSGCGKSSLLKAAAGFIKPQSGAFTLNGNAISGPGPDRVVVFQEFDQLAPWKTVLQNVIFALRASRTLDKVQARERAEHYLHRVGLGNFLHAYPHTLSGGMKQRVAIARALAMEPAVLLMDEPFAALDALTRRKMQEELLQLWEETRVTLMFVTHSIEEALVVGNRILLLSPHPGRVRAELNSHQFSMDSAGSEQFQAATSRIHRLLFEELPAFEADSTLAEHSHEPA